MTAPLTPAPFFAELAEGPEGGAAYWLTTQDGTRIRLGLWPRDAARGTVLMFPGRTEYIEKYGRVAQDFTAAGYAMIAIDWRGQGLADRPAHQRDMGHVLSFAEYQQDVAAVLAALAQLDVPKPWYLIGHSMGGAIGLRALLEGLPVARAAFSAPMWGIRLAPASRLAAKMFDRLAGVLGIEQNFAPSTGPAGPIAFEGNRLTTDRAQFDYMERQTDAHPELALGGPSIRWLTEAIRECAILVDLPAPDMPVLTYLGSEEKIVDPAQVHNRMASWPGGRLEIIEGAEHEVLMEAPDKRTRVITGLIGFFDG